MKLFALISLLLTGSAHAGTIVVQPSQTLRNSTGFLRCALWDKGDGFPGESDNAVQLAESAISGQTATCTFTGVAKGRYAISILHDENKNGKIDLNLIGIPTEGFGASNDTPPGPTSPPSFTDAAFDYSGSDLKVSLLMRYIL